VAELRAATNLDAIAEVVKRARASLRGEDLGGFDKVYSDVIIASTGQAEADKSGAAIEVLVRFLNTKGLAPAKADEGRVRAALDRARRAAR
jgi:hypothetical protein